MKIAILALSVLAAAAGGALVMDYAHTSGEEGPAHPAPAASPVGSWVFVNDARITGELELRSDGTIKMRDNRGGMTQEQYAGHWQLHGHTIAFSMQASSRDPVEEYEGLWTGDRLEMYAAENPDHTTVYVRPDEAKRIAEAPRPADDFEGSDLTGRYKHMTSDGTVLLLTAYGNGHFVLTTRGINGPRYLAWGQYVRDRDRVILAADAGATGWSSLSLKGTWADDRLDLVNAATRESMGFVNAWPHGD